MTSHKVTSPTPRRGATPLISISHVSFAHGSTPVLEDVELVLEPGWTGLTGANGAGKTTLLGLIAGALRPDAGEVRIEPRGGRVAWLAQTLAAPDDAIMALAAREEREAIRLRAELALVPEGLARWATLSPGERRRWQIAAAIDARPDVLLLDEPEGHLDATGRALLVRALRRFEGVGVLVAHDRALLDAVTRTTVELARGRARSFPGAWSSAQRAWEAERHGAEARRRELREAHERARGSLDRARREAAAATHQRSARARMKSRHDSDARSVLAGNLAEWGARAHDKSATRQARVVDELERALDEARVERRGEAKAFAFEYVAPAQRVIAGGTFARVGAGDRTLARDVTVWLERDARVHLAGDNGAGKTTLVNALLATLTVPAARVLVLPQELDEGATDAMRAELRAAPPEVRGRALSLHAALGARPTRILEEGRLSPGEARKLHLALGLARGVCALVLDEPTNHLDLPSVERLQEALCAWPGALLLVSHDERLARAVCRTRWHLAHGRLEITEMTTDVSGLDSGS